MNGQLNKQKFLKLIVLLVVATHIFLLGYQIISWDLLPAGKDNPHFPKAILALEETWINTRSSWNQSSLKWVWNYLGASNLQHRWHMFAPNPPKKSVWVSVRAVERWKPSSVSCELGPGAPIYEDPPLFATYSNELHTIFSFKPGPWVQLKFASFFLREKASKGLSADLAKYWAYQYRIRNGRLPLEIHVLVETFAMYNIFESHFNPPVKRTLWFRWMPENKTL